MPEPITRGHPLRRLFTGLTERTFFEGLAWPDPEVTGYLADLLTDFAHVDNVYRIRNAAGQRVREVAEMLAEGDLLHRATTLEREREVHKHIGDYTLFMTGLFREHVERRASTGFYVREGKRAYQVVAAFERSALKPDARLFAALADRFEGYAKALSYMKRVYLRPPGSTPELQPVLRLIREW